jgi:hypothetical protein
VVQQILIDFDSVDSAIKRIIAERSTVPEAGNIRQVEGTSVGVTSPFHAELEYSASLLASIVETIRLELDATESAIRKAVEDVVEKDASHADDAKAILAAVDSIVVEDTPAPTPANPAASGPTKSW